MNKSHLPLLLMLMAILLTACVKKLENEDIFLTTRCHGVLLEQRTQQPVVGMRVQLTNGDKIPVYALSSMDGTFLLEVTAEQISQNYYLKITADSLYEEKLVSLKEVGYGKKEFDLGTVYINGPEVPIVSTGEVTGIDAVSAQGHGEVLDGGKSNVTVRGLCWSTHQYPTLADPHTANGSGMGSFQGELTGLAVATTYYVRAYATNGVGTGYGNQQTFTTLAGLPAVSTDGVSEVQATTAACGGTVTADGGFPVTARGVCWSITPQPTATNAHTVNGAGMGQFVSSLTGLQPGTLYYVRAYATNVNGTVYGEQRTFTTATGLPSVTTAAVTDVANGSALCGGVVLSDGGFSVTARGVCYSTTPGPTISGPHTQDGAGLGSFVSQLMGLTAGATYYVRAYATNANGTVYGEERTFVII
jgi:FlaG/FlaF family flagellin (archaellin)